MTSTGMINRHESVISGNNTSGNGDNGDNNDNTSQYDYDLHVATNNSDNMLK